MFYSEGQKENSPKPSRANNLTDAVAGLEEGIVKSIHLQRQNLTDGAIAPLINALGQNYSLTYLDIRDNLLTDKSAFALAEALQQNGQLIYFYVAGNRFTQVGLEKLQAVIEDGGYKSDVLDYLKQKPTCLPR